MCASKSDTVCCYAIFATEADYLLYHGFTMPHRWSDVTPDTQTARLLMKRTSCFSFAQGGTPK